MKWGAAAWDRKMKLWQAQGGLCCYCFRPISLEPTWRGDPERISEDHVVPRAIMKGLQRNRVAAHQSCNLKKGHRMPNGCEQIAAAWVWARMDALFGPGAL
jgi:5-methylcytosine-specific restriction endonuclease McrA